MASPSCHGGVELFSVVTQWWKCVRYRFDSWCGQTQALFHNCFYQPRSRNGYRLELGSNQHWTGILSRGKREKKHSKYLRQFRCSYWWRARHVGVYKPLFMTSKKCWNMGMTRELAPTLIRQFLDSYWSRATTETVVPHHTIRAQHSLIRSCLPEGDGGPYFFIVERNHWTIKMFAFIYFLTKSVDRMVPKSVISVQTYGHTCGNYEE